MPPDTVNNSLRKIAQGAGMALIGTLLAWFLLFISRLLVARIGTEAQYGVFSLAFVILNICVVIATLGLQQGATRNIAYARGQNGIETVKVLVIVSVQLGLLASVCLGAALFFTSDLISTRIFHDVALGYPLRILACGIPFFSLMNVLTAIFQGFDDVKPGVYFQDILRSLLFVLFLAPVIFLRLPFTSVYWALLASFAVSCIVLIVYAIKRLPLPMRLPYKAGINLVARELLLFSLPLLGVAMLRMITMWVDTLMLGSFKGSADVGLYNAAYPLAQFVTAPLGAMLLIYTPVTAGLYAQNALSEIRRNFSILTKWLCSATLPLFLILFLFPETILSFLFGANYASAGSALRILSLGAIITNLFGPNASALVTMGKSQFIMWTILAGATLDIGLNIALIPPLGIEGAAIASAVAMTLIGFAYSWKLYSLSGAQPMSKNLVKPTLVSLAMIFLFQYIFKSFVSVAWWMLPFLFILYYGVYCLAVLLTRSFDQEDISLLLTIEKRMGVNLSLVKSILRRFL